MWLDWAQKLLAIAQTGLHFTRNPYEVERFEAVKAIAEEMIAQAASVDVGHVRELFAQESGYVTPKVDVRGAVFRDGQVLLVRERSDGGWTLPGGWADVGDSPSDAVEREILEESGYRARAVRLLALYDRRKHDHPPHPFHIYKVFFLCELEGGAPVHSDETDGVGFFSLDDLPPLSTARVTAAQLRRLYELACHPDWPPDFD
ncbi:MAG: NUDIX hydrolase [Anaerolineae bacterium]